MKGTLGSRQTTVPNVHTYLANVSVIGDVRGHNEGDDDEKKRGYDEPQPPPVALLLTLLLQVATAPAAARRRSNGGHGRRYRGLANVAPQGGEAHCGAAVGAAAVAVTRPQVAAASARPASATSARLGPFGRCRVGIVPGVAADTGEAALYE